MFIVEQKEWSFRDASRAENIEQGVRVANTVAARHSVRHNKVERYDLLLNVSFRNIIWHKKDERQKCIDWKNDFLFAENESFTGG